MTEKSTIKDSVFTMLFTEPKYARELFIALHPECSDVTEEEVEAFPIENVFINGIYNDVGLVAKGRFIILVEAQSDWNPNMPIRGLLYLAETYKRYVNNMQIDLFSSKRVELPVPEFYVIYTGDRKTRPEYQILSDHYFGSESMSAEKRSETLELKIKMIYNSADGDIVFQYINFCKVYSEQLTTFKGDRHKAIQAAIEICKDENILKDFISRHSTEVSDMYIGFDEEWYRRVHIKSEMKIAREEGLAEGREAGREEARSELQPIIAQQEKQLSEKDAEIKALKQQMQELLEQK